MLLHGNIEILVVLTMNPTGSLENILLLEISNVMTIKESLYTPIFFLTFLQLTYNEVRVKSGTNLLYLKH